MRQRFILPARDQASRVHQGTERGRDRLRWWLVYVVTLLGSLRSLSIFGLVSFISSMSSVKTPSSISGISQPARSLAV